MSQATKMNERIRAARIAAGKTQQQVADAIGITVVSVNRIENGHIQPTVETLRKIAETLGVEPGTLI